MSAKLLSPATLAGLSLQNHVVMAPMTRSRAPGNLPGELMATYYGQRAGAGLLITEGTSPSPNGLGYARIPGLFNAEQAQGWAAVAKAVHARGGRVSIQLMHAGRIGHPANLPEGAELLAPSAIAAAGQVWTDAQGMQDHPVPREMSADDLARTRDEYVHSAKLAREAGIDLVELHAANGYLLAQFLNPKSNQRTDAYGGSGENRRRFLLELVDATVAAIGAGRVGVRISPFNAFNDLAANYEGEAEETLALVDELSRRGIAYLSLIATPGAVPVEFVDQVRKRFSGTLILAGDYDARRAEADLQAGRADLIAFGRPFIANPDLPARLAKGAPLAEMQADKLYSPGPEGYTDYPTLHESVAA
ncbi:alkene reductase [Arenimonas caeni]|uniref:Alkene reductase n=1 Tax=Arenimonas caeni TaxID=2058085 RepID=A0A2P6M7E1_9GAMM|nr:alkene reductase [Arenimonas caeni]MDY0022110.1 alkene reductase [Arenimonas caeni]PRH81898.1 alkene reductase [Arenimonas caeni]